MSTDKYYVYKTSCFINNRKYIGSYKTNSWGNKTAYLGSNRQLLEDISKYGRVNFKKDILFTFLTQEEAFSKEEELVTQQICDDKKYYNILKGGRALKGELRYMGYHNPDFENRWNIVYNDIKLPALHYILKTNLPDRLIEKIIKKDFKYSVKMPRVIKYLEHLGLLSFKEKIRTKDYFSKGGGIQTAVKTIFKETRIEKEYKSYKENFLQDLKEFINLTSDSTITDSMIYNQSVPNSLGEKFWARVKYYDYLGIYTLYGKKRIGIRGRLPNAQRATGLKTLFKRNPKTIDFIEIRKEGIYENRIHFNGESFQKARI